MRGVTRCQGSTGRMKKHRYSNEFKVTAVRINGDGRLWVDALSVAMPHHLR